MKELMLKWTLAKQEESDANKKRISIEADLYREVMKTQKIAPEGSTKVECDGLKLEIVSSYTVTVDQAKAKERPDLFSCKYSYSKTLLKTLNEDQVAVIDSMISVKPAKPSFKVSVL